MNTPPAGIPPSPGMQASASAMHGASLKTQLNQLIRSREEATPEAESPKNVVHCYKWQCEELHNHFSANEIETHRRKIRQNNYWGSEYHHYMKVLDTLARQKAHEAHGVTSEPTADHMQTMAIFIRRLLKHGGLSPTQINKSRHSIEDQQYWQAEVDLFQPLIVLREEQMREAVRKMDQKGCKRPTAQQRQNARGIPPNNTRNRPPHDDIAGRTRARTREANRVLRSSSGNGSGSAKAAR
ncbi:hypothetical protein B0I35DRAFT_483250 [Stachybotrys elegans]|uniref:Uncharacterized protein n=1 Tax=Stachybotrys elegans TaxID=80388 RepID=A0A8K0WKX3_9HYPO|nr:hypothetical protein B0I35DRAFT_483250 [Stachybotrys elegans]